MFSEHLILIKSADDHLCFITKTVQGVNLNSLLEHYGHVKVSCKNKF